MIVAKQVADLLTGLRAFLAFLFPVVGVVTGADSLQLAIWMLLACWTTDILDGPLARRSRRPYRTWLGDHDLAVDITVSVGLLIFMVQAQFLYSPLAAVYALAWGLLFWRIGVPPALGMLVQAPIYARFIWVGLTRSFYPGYWLLVWPTAAVVFTWPRFPREVVPGFLDGIASLIRGGARRD